MGNEPQEKSVKQEDFERLSHLLNIMIGKYGTTEVLTLVRHVHDTNVGKV
jgi:hypothetical protein